MDRQGLQCMEIWGGTEAADTGLALPGIEAWLSSRPFQGAADGGDIHYVSLCGHGLLSRFLVADVAGHGQMAAPLARQLRDLMAEHVNTLDQTRLVQTLNQSFAALDPDGEFATAIVATYYARDARLTLCNAGHPHPLWHSAADGHWHALHPETAESHKMVHNLPLGVLAHTDYEQFSIDLGRGDLVVIYTDSLTEARSPDGRELEEAGLLRLARSVPNRSAGEFCHGLLAKVEAYCGPRGLNDDMTVVVLRHTDGSV